MPAVLFNILNNDVIETHIRGKVYNFAKLDRALEYTKECIKKTNQKRFGIDFDCSLCICVNILSNNGNPVNFGDCMFPMMVEE